MKRRTTRAALAQSSQKTVKYDTESESNCSSGSDNENDPLATSNSENSSEEEQETEGNGNWIMEDEDFFPNPFPNIPRFNGPPFESHSNNSKKVLNINNPKDLTPLQWFLEYLPESFWNKVVKFTNDQVDNDSEWKELTISELWVFLALLFLRAIKKPPSYRDLWSSDWKYYCAKVHALGMQRRRFELIRKCIKFNNGKEDENDPYWRVRSILDELKSNCKRIVKPPQKLSLDEMSPGYRGRTKNTISMKGKKSKKHFNIKAITLPNGAMYTFYLRNEQLNTGGDYSDDYDSLTPTSKAVVHLVLELPSNWHHIFVDNLYTNLNLFKYLYIQHKTVCSGTWREKRGIPNGLQLTQISF